MKKQLSITILLLSCIAFAQIPAGYYNTATDTGYTLKTQLHNIINNHSDQGYGALWTLFEGNAFLDYYQENDGTVYDIYSENPNGTDPYNFTPTTDKCGSYNSEADCYNREHLVPQSYFNSASPMKNDPFHVVPSDGWVNGKRGNLPFGKVGNSPNYTSQNGSKRGTSQTSTFFTYSGTVFEPLDAFKGDVARAFFYFATRYENQMNSFYTNNSSQAEVMFDGSTDKVFSDDFIYLLLDWHLSDPVSTKEINQNNAIYNFQGNRNPYIDHPEYVCQIWATQCGTLHTANQNVIATAVTIYPNPSITGNFHIYSNQNIAQISIYNTNGQLVQAIQNPTPISSATYKINNLSQGFYFVNIQTANSLTIKKIIVK